MFMKRSILIVVVGLTATMVVPGAAVLLPGMPCPNPDVSCSVSPGTSTAADPTFVLPNDPGMVRLGIFVVPGDVVLFETPNGLLTDSSTWSDVVQFSDSPTGAGSIATTFPDAEPVGILLPPGFSLSTNAVGITETQTGVGSDAVDFTTYTAGSAVYQIHSDSPQNELTEPMEGTPEPATMGLLGLGLSSIYVISKLKTR